jgi:colanic acid/amylovoran biosynthesis glycosyltransferase
VHYSPVWLGATETWLHTQFVHLPPEVESHVVCLDTANLDQFQVPRLHVLRERSPLRFLWEKGLWKLRLRNHLNFLVEQARRYDAKVLHSHFGHVGWWNLGSARRANLRHVVTFYGHDVTRIPQEIPRWRRRYTRLFREAALILCEGPHMARSIVGLGCPEEKVRVHHLGIDIGRFPFRPRFWTGDGPLRVLIAASFREKKGIPYAIRALGILSRHVDLEVTVIGDAGREPRNREEKKHILAAVSDAGPSSRVRLLGYQPYTSMIEEAYNHHIFLSPSVTAADGDTEGGAPISIIEMAASGMPVVSTTHCDIPEVVGSAGAPLLADERDVEGLLSRLMWLVDHRSEWERILEPIRTRVQTEYSAAEQGKKLGRIYAEVVDGAADALQPQLPSKSDGEQ